MSLAESLTALRLRRPRVIFALRNGASLVGVQRYRNAYRIFFRKPRGYNSRSSYRRLGTFKRLRPAIMTASRAFFTSVRYK